MHSIIQLAGGIVVFLGVVASAFGVVIVGQAVQQADKAAGFMFVISGLGTIVSGAILYCFGAMVEHLIAIRRNTEEQLRIFQERLGS